MRLTGIIFSEEALENDFTLLTSQLCQVPADAFMFRDFQSRNIMIRKEEVWFIDYQGGRQGALHYDVASLLYDAIIAIPDDQREQLLPPSISKDFQAGLLSFCTSTPVTGNGGFRTTRTLRKETAFH